VLFSSSAFKVFAMKIYYAERSRFERPYWGEGEVCDAGAWRKRVESEVDS